MLLRESEELSVVCFVFYNSDRLHFRWVSLGSECERFCYSYVCASEILGF